MPTRDAVLALLSDGRWHSRTELEGLAHYPDAWIRALRLGGYLIDERPGFFRLARKRGEHLAVSPASQSVRSHRPPPRPGY